MQASRLGFWEMTVSKVRNERGRNSETPANQTKMHYGRKIYLYHPTDCHLNHSGLKIYTWLSSFLVISQGMLFSKETYVASKFYVLSVHVFPGKQTHDLGIASVMLIVW